MQEIRLVASIQRKLKIFQSVFIPALIYGLYSLTYASSGSQSLNKLQLKTLGQVFGADHSDPIHHVFFSPGLKDRAQATGRRRGGKIP